MTLFLIRIENIRGPSNRSSLKELSAKKQRMITTFRQLKPLFTNQTLSLAWKRQLYRAIVLGQFTYGLCSLWVSAVKKQGDIEREPRRLLVISMAQIDRRTRIIAI